MGMMSTEEMVSKIILYFEHGDWTDHVAREAIIARLREEDNAERCIARYSDKVVALESRWQKLREWLVSMAHVMLVKRTIEKMDALEQEADHE